MRANCLAVHYKRPLTNRTNLYLTCEVVDPRPGGQGEARTPVVIPIDQVFKHTIGFTSAKRRKIIAEEMPASIEVREHTALRGQRYCIERADMIAWVERVRHRLGIDEE